MRAKYIIYLIAFTFILSSCGPPKSTETAEINLRLQWVLQSQFAGYIVAYEKGYYSDRNINVNLLAAGPDLKPHMTVASGTDHIGIGVSNQIIAARSNDVPLVVIAQIFQDSANRYVLKAENRISNLSELKGKKIGLWLGGDEVEFVAMLKTEGLNLSDMTVVPQGFSVIPFLQDQYILSQVTVYNELNLIKDEVYEDNKLQVLSPRDYDSAIVGDMIFCHEEFLKKNKELVSKFLEASTLGWKYCFENPDEAVEIVVKYNPELNLDAQKKQLDAVLRLIKSGKTVEKGIGFVDEEDYVIAERILFESKQIDKRVAPSECYDLSAWNLINPALKKID